MGELKFKQKVVSEKDAICNSNFVDVATCLLTESADWTGMRLGWLLGVTAVLATQQQLLPTENETISSISIVDVLANSTDHALLVRALQRARLIPLLNKLIGSTLFAPSDDAIRRAKEKESNLGIWSYATAEHDEPHRATRDNLQLALRDTLLYHLLNSTLFLPHYTVPTQPLLLETLYYPSLSSFNSSFPVPPSLPGSPPDDPNPDAPRRQEGLLRGEGQRVRIVRKKDGLYVGGDWKGQGGIAIIANSLRNATNGDIIVLDGILDKPVDLGQSIPESCKVDADAFVMTAEQIQTNPQLSTLASLLPLSILKYLRTAAHMSLFAPTNDAWSSLSPLEMRYLRSGFAETDLSQIFGEGASTTGAGAGKVAYINKLLYSKNTSTGSSSSAFRPSITHISWPVSTILGGRLDVTEEKGGAISVNGTLVETGDILAKNGALPLLGSLP